MQNQLADLKISMCVKTRPLLRSMKRTSPGRGRAILVVGVCIFPNMKRQNNIKVLFLSIQQKICVIIIK